MFDQLSQNIDRVTKKPWVLMLAFILLSLIVRVFTLTPPLIDHDESTYLVIANEWLKGSVPFVDYMDIKPVGIYAIYASVTALFGQSILAIRLMTIVVIGLTGFMLFKAKILHQNNRKLALICGVFYVLLMSVDSWGWSGNTEVFFNFFTALGLYLMLRLKTVIHAIAIGLIMGIGFMIKYHVMFDFTAFLIMAVFGLALNLNKLQFKTRFAYSVIMGLFFLIPIMLVYWYYWQIGNGDAFMEATFAIPSRYNSSLGIMDRMWFVLSFFLMLLPLSLMIIMELINSYRHKSKEGWFPLFWIGLVTFALMMTGKTFQHYYIQALLPVCFFGFDYLLRQTYFHRQKTNLIITVCGFLIVLVGLVGQSKLHEKNHSNRELITLLKSEMEEEDVLFSQRPVLNYILDKSPPNKYIHNTIISNPEHVKAYQIDKKKEFNRIISSNPKYMFCYNNGPGELSQYVINNYSIIKSYPDGYNLWIRD